MSWIHHLPRRLLMAGALLAVLFSISTVTAAEAVPGVTDTEIRIGNLGPQTGPAGIYDDVRKGIQAYFDYTNDQGGVHGRKLIMIAYDDQYQPAKTVRLTRRLVEQDRVFAMVGNIGSASISAVKNYLIKHNVPMVMICSAASEFFDPPISNFMGSCTPSYALQGKLILDYAVTQLGSKRIAIAYQNDDYGTPISKAISNAIKNYPGVEIVAKVNFQSADTDLSAQAQKLQQAKPDAILVPAIMAPSTHLKKALYRIGVNSANTAYITTQEVGHNPKLFELAGKGVWEGTYTPASLAVNDSGSDEMKLFAAQLKKSFPKVPSASSTSQTGWAIGQVFVEALKRTKVLTRDNFLNSFYGFDNWTGSLYSGVTFTPDNHRGISALFMSRAKDGGFIPVSGLFSLESETGKFIERERAL